MHDLGRGEGTAQDQAPGGRNGPLQQSMRDTAGPCRLNAAWWVRAYARARRLPAGGLAKEQDSAWCGMWTMRTYHRQGVLNKCSTEASAALNKTSTINGARVRGC